MEGHPSADLSLPAGITTMSDSTTIRFWKPLARKVKREGRGKNETRTCIGKAKTKFTGIIEGQEFKQKSVGDRFGAQAFKNREN